MKTRESLKNVLILVLLVGMAYLALVTWTANNPSGEWFGLFTRGTSVYEDMLEAPEVELCPQSVSIKNKVGRFGAVYDEVAIQTAYERIESVLQQAVQTAEHGARVDEASWRSAIQTEMSVLCDFGCDVPMSVFSFWMGRNGQKEFEPYRVRYLCLAAEDGITYLFGKDYAGQTRFCFLTGVSEKALSESIGEVQPNNISLAIESNLPAAPELLLSAKAKIQTLIARNTLPGIAEENVAALLKLVNLNPNTVSRHEEQDGTRIFVGDSSTLKLSPNGMVEYRRLREDEGYATGLMLSAEETTVWAKAEAARELVFDFDRFQKSQGTIYLGKVTEAQGEVEALFYRVVGGVPVDCEPNGYFARVLMVGNQIDEIEFRFRSYEQTTALSAVLPANLAAASISSETAGISLRYRDSGAESVAAEWFVMK